MVHIRAAALCAMMLLEEPWRSQSAVPRPPQEFSHPIREPWGSEQDNWRSQPPEDALHSIKARIAGVLSNMKEEALLSDARARAGNRELHPAAPDCGPVPRTRGGSEAYSHRSDRCGRHRRPAEDARRSSHCTPVGGAYGRGRDEQRGFAGCSCPIDAHCADGSHPHLNPAGSECGCDCSCDSGGTEWPPFPSTPRCTHAWERHGNSARAGGRGGYGARCGAGDGDWRAMCVARAIDGPCDRCTSRRCSCRGSDVAPACSYNSREDFGGNRYLPVFDDAAHVRDCCHGYRERRVLNQESMLPLAPSRLQSHLPGHHCNCSACIGAHYCNPIDWDTMYHEPAHCGKLCCDHEDVDCRSKGRQRQACMRDVQWYGGDPRCRDRSPSLHEPQGGDFDGVGYRRGCRGLGARPACFPLESALGTTRPPHTPLFGSEGCGRHNLRDCPSIPSVGPTTQRCRRRASPCRGCSGMQGCASGICSRCGHRNDRMLLGHHEPGIAMGSARDRYIQHRSNSQGRRDPSWGSGMSDLEL